MLHGSREWVLISRVDIAQLVLFPAVVLIDQNVITLRTWSSSVFRERSKCRSAYAPAHNENCALPMVWISTTFFVHKTVRKR